MICIIDNYDSFTFNIVQYLNKLGGRTVVFKNDEVTINDLINISPSKIIISPGPCSPKDSGISLEVISYFSGRIPILGICLGHEAIAEFFGGKIILAKRVMHGKVSSINHNGFGVFKNIPTPFNANRYHSLIVDDLTLPPHIEVTAWCETEEFGFEIMGLKHKIFDVEGVQFHPESILSEYGLELINNFISR
ncbi:aminodeoxychorismate/anthranilate synthase component II [Xenorhabdus nematophila]|uniref:anthranilate synthase component II n=1 Tax=Xenorhabdus nematophila TaxID=628 RepID=UPI0003275C9E|nr:aminodeoxychorismate/anthranilate synthase component II [Xenorhabdus nematophila]CCW32479.1 Para-aminobenzoate synthase glutamine amidotransferase component II [Xenorhabdus nematophila F1]